MNKIDALAFVFRCDAASSRTNQI